MTDHIENAVVETDGLKAAIDLTQGAMEELTANVNEEVNAIEVQKQSTEKIHSHIQARKQKISPLGRRVPARSQVS